MATQYAENNLSALSADLPDFSTRGWVGICRRCRLCAGVTKGNLAFFFYNTHLLTRARGATLPTNGQALPFDWSSAIPDIAPIAPPVSAGGRDA